MVNTLSVSEVWGYGRLEYPVYQYLSYRLKTTQTAKHLITFKLINSVPARRFYNLSGT